MTRKKLGILKSKKGYIFDVLTIVVFLFVVGIVILGMYHVMSSVNTQFAANPSIATDSKTILSNYTTNYIKLYDGLFLALLVALTLGAVVSAFFIDTHPVLLPFMLILIAIFIFVSAGLANAFYHVESQSMFSSFAESFVGMHFVMNHLAYYAMITGIAIVIALFAKANQ